MTRRAGSGLVMAALMLGACGGNDDAGSQGRVSVAASFYPLAFAAERVGGDLVEVTNLTPPGIEPHDLELAPDDIESIVSADVVLLLGSGFQPAVEEAAAGAEGAVVDVLAGLDTLPPPEGDDGAEGDELAADPHVWLDPLRFAAVVDRVVEALTEADPAHASTYRTNADALAAELADLDAEFRDGLASCSSRLLVVNHAAFGYLADAYDLEQEAISGISPEAEPDPARLAELTELVEAEGVTTVFTEELTSPEVAETLADEAGVTTALLDPLEGLTPEQVEAGEDYGSIMRGNLEALRGGLGCAA